METDTLMLKRSLGSAFSSLYVDWAVERLCEGSDTPSLRILAGLNPKFESEEIESYFRNSCKELKIECVNEVVEAQQSAGLVQRSYECGETAAEEALHMLARIYADTGYSDPLLAVFSDIEEELSFKGTDHEEIFYPPDDLQDLDAALKTEFALMADGLRLDLPKEFCSFTRCEDCSYIGKSRFRHKTLWDKLKGLIPGLYPRPPLWHTCFKCGSFDYKIMMDPEVRNDYYNRLKSEENVAEQLVTCSQSKPK
ncbi:MAG: hypothetical protein QM496_10645 [Verrucomicrobiota bacterium]